MQDQVAISGRVQLRQAIGEQRLASFVKIRRVQVGRATLEWMKERARQGREHGRPAQQAEQGIQQRVLHVMHGRIVLMQVVACDEFDRRRCGWPLQRQVGARHSVGGRAGGPALTHGAIQARQHAGHALAFLFAFGRVARLQRQAQSLVIPLHALVHTYAAMARAGVGAVFVSRFRRRPILRAFTRLPDPQQHLGAALFQPGVLADAALHRRQQGCNVRAVVQRRAARMQHQVGIHVRPRLERA
ncbi:hypothetical protein D3C71_1532760 [compost metagenome]